MTTKKPIMDETEEFIYEQGRASAISEFEKMLKVEIWEDDEYILTLDGKPFGCTISKANAEFFKERISNPNSRS